MRSWGFRGDIQVDGGITNETIAACSSAGANVFVAGTYLYKATSMPSAVRALHQAIEIAIPRENGAPVE